MSIQNKTLIDINNLGRYHTKNSALIQAKMNILANAIEETNGNLADQQEKINSLEEIVNANSNSNSNCVHTLPNEYDYGMSLNNLFDTFTQGIEDLTYEAWENDENSIKQIIYDWEKLCNFVKSVEDNTIITEASDAYGGDKRLLFVDIEYEEAEKDRKGISIISLNTYAYSPITSYIRVDGISNIDYGEYMRCTISIGNATDEFNIVTNTDVENKISEYDETIKTYIDDTLNGLTTRKFGK